MHKKIEAIIGNIAKKYNRPKQVITAVFRSQFECAREATESGKNIRFPRIGLLYNRNNKNPEYLKMKEDEQKED